MGVRGRGEGKGGARGRTGGEGGSRERGEEGVEGKEVKRKGRRGRGEEDQGSRGRAEGKGVKKKEEEAEEGQHRTWWSGTRKPSRRGTDRCMGGDSRKLSPNKKVMGFFVLHPPIPLHHHHQVTRAITVHHASPHATHKSITMIIIRLR